MQSVHFICGWFKGLLILWLYWITLVLHHFQLYYTPISGPPHYSVFLPFQCDFDLSTERTCFSPVPVNLIISIHKINGKLRTQPNSFMSRRRRDSNSGPLACKASAIAITLQIHLVAISCYLSLYTFIGNTNDLNRDQYTLNIFIDASINIWDYLNDRTSIILFFFFISTKKKFDFVKNIRTVWV